LALKPHVTGGDLAGGRTGRWAGALLRQRKRRWSRLLWFGLEIKRNLEWPAVIWVRNKENSGARRRDPMSKTC
jgi:hypothetical protein